MTTSLPASMRQQSAPNLKFEIGEMYKIATRESDAWGIEGYQVPKKHLDPHKVIWEKKIQEDLKNKKKPGIKAPKATKRGHFLDDEIKRHNPCYPEPNKLSVQYDKSDAWKMDDKLIKQYKNTNKVDQKLNKRTYIDQIIRTNQGPKKTPGVGAYNVQKTTKQVEADVEKMKKMPAPKHGDLPNYLNDVEYMAGQNPGPNSYHPKLPTKDTFEWQVGKKNMVSNTYYNIKPKEWIAKHTVKKEKIKEKPEPFHPYPVAYDTFGKKLLQTENKNKSSSNIKHWGTTKRFLDKEQEKKREKLQNPAPYSILAKWPESKKAPKGAASQTMKGKSKSTTKFFDFNLISKGTQSTRSIYY